MTNVPRIYEPPTLRSIIAHLRRKRRRDPTALELLRANLRTAVALHYPDDMMALIQLLVIMEKADLWPSIESGGQGELYELLRRAAQPREPGVISRVFIICNAYESGVGHGLEQDELPNPYTPGGEEYEAYSIGYDQGRERASRRPT